MSDERPLPEKDVVDLVIRLLRAGVSLVPGGGAVTELASILKTPYEQRRDEWLDTLWERLKRLEDRVAGFDVNHLADNEQFVTAVLRAAPMAVREHKQQKLEALRNAVLNVAAGSAPEEDQQMMFLQAIDDLTVSHIVFLRNRASRGRPSRRGGLYLLAEQIRPPGVADHMLAQIIRDLKNSGFLDVDTALDQLDAGTLPNTGVKLTEYGCQFLSFITSPLEEERAPA